MYATWIGLPHVTNNSTNIRLIDWFVPDWSSGYGSYTNRADLMWFSSPASSKQFWSFRAVSNSIEALAERYELGARSALLYKDL